jgi:hypothetical protein
MVLMERQHLSFMEVRNFPIPFGVLNERLVCVESGVETWHAINWDSKRTPDNHISKQEDSELSTRALLRLIKISPSVWL